MSGSEIQVRTGTVVKKNFADGSKSEHAAYFLITGSGEELVLRRREANPFMDSFFEKYINKQVESKGIIDGYIFFVANDSIKEL